MTVRVAHLKVSSIPDSDDTSLVRPSDWNEDHVVEGLGTAAEADTGDFATAAQGALADTALQSAAIANMLETSDIGVTVQGYDADLAAWAGVNPSSYSTTAQIAAAYQPLDGDLTAIAALTTTTYGRSLLTMTAAEDVRNSLDTGPYVATRTAMKALDTTKETVCFLSESGRQGVFLWTTGNFSTHHAADTLEGVYVKATAIASTAGSWVRLADRLTPQMFGALADGATNDTPALAAFQTIVMLTGIAGYIPDGDYACADNLSWDFTTPPNTYQNINITGSGIERAKLTFAATKTFKITNTDASNAAFYKRISGFQAIGNVAGIFCLIGATTLAAAFNWIDVEHFHVTNTSSNAANIAVKIEKCYGCHISVVASCAAGLGTNGCAVQIVDSNFCTFKLFPGSALYGLQLYSIDAVCSGNVFLANDIEVNGTGIYIDTAGVTDNTWIGGVIAYNEAGDYGISASAGARNRFIGVHHGGSGNLFNGDVGIEFNPTIDKLQSNRTYYVRSDGSNSNDGRANTSGRAFLTIQKAIDVVATLDLNGFNITIQVQDGTWTAAAVMSNKLVGKGTVTIQGNTGTPANVVWNVTSGHDLYASNGAKVTVSGIEFRTTTAGSCLVSEGAGSQITIGSSVRFGACAGAHTLAFGGSIYGRSNYSIVGAAPYHWLSQVDGVLDVQGVTITITGTPAFSTTFVRADSGGLVAAGFNTFSGSATGVRSQCVNGTIDSNSGSSTYFPGNSGGTDASIQTSYLKVGTAAAEEGVVSALQIATVQGSAVALTNNISTAQSLFASANDALTVRASTTYRFKGKFFVNTGTTTHTTAFGFGGTATATSIRYQAKLWSGTSGTINTTAPSVVDHNALTAKVLNATSAAAFTLIEVEGIVRVNAAGTLIPQITFSAGPTGTCEVAVDSFIEFVPIGSNTTAAVGQWA